MELKPFNCTIRVFNPEDGATIAVHLLPVDSPDADHAAASTLANAASFTPKAETDSTGAITVKPVAFACTKVEVRK